MARGTAVADGGGAAGAVPPPTLPPACGVGTGCVDPAPAGVTQPARTSAPTSTACSVFLRGFVARFSCYNAKNTTELFRARCTSASASARWRDVGNAIPSMMMSIPDHMRAAHRPTGGLARHDRPHHLAGCVHAQPGHQGHRHLATDRAGRRAWPLPHTRAKFFFRTIVGGREKRGRAADDRRTSAGRGRDRRRLRLVGRLAWDLTPPTRAPPAMSALHQEIP